MLYLQISYNRFVYKTIIISYIYIYIYPDFSFVYFHLFLIFGSVYIYKICVVCAKIKSNKMNLRLCINMFICTYIHHAENEFYLSI